MELGPGAPTPADRAGRRRRPRPPPGAGARGSACTDAVLRQLRGVCADVDRRPGVIGEASRDWWPLAMTWALDGEVAGLRRRRSPDRPPPQEVAAVLATCNDGRMPVTAAAVAPACCGASVPVFGGVVLDMCGLCGHRRRRRHLARRRRAAGTFGDHFEHELRTAHGLTVWPLAAVDGACPPSAAGSPAAAPASSRPATARSRTWSSASTWRSPTADRSPPAGSRARRPGPTSPSCSSAPRAPSASSPAPGCGCTRHRVAERRGAWSLRLLHRRPRRVPPHPATRRHARGAAPLRRRRVRPQLPPRRRSQHPAGARRGRPRDRRRRDVVVVEDEARRRRRERSTTRLSTRGWRSATTSPRSSR